VFAFSFTFSSEGMPMAGLSALVAVRMISFFACPTALIGKARAGIAAGTCAFILWFLFSWLVWLGHFLGI
jgi:hypothetical protein